MDVRYAFTARACPCHFNNVSKVVTIVECSDHDLIVKLGKEVEREGKTIVFPTDTVYGLGSNPLSEEGVNSCFEIKRREESKHFPVLFSDTTRVEEFVEFGSTAKMLAKEFWPGRLTLVLRAKRRTDLPRNLIGEDGSLAVRIPNHACCSRLIKACGGALIGTSANISGERPFTDPDDKGLESFASRCDYLLRGRCDAGISSTVLSIKEPGVIEFLREGAVSRRQIEDYLGKTRRAAFSDRSIGI